jgi:hypothetical protein
VTWSPGDVVVYRSLASDGRYRSGLPVSILHDCPEVVVGTPAHGTVVSRPVAADGRDVP